MSNNAVEKNQETRGLEGSGSSRSRSSYPTEAEQLAAILKDELENSPLRPFVRPYKNLERVMQGHRFA